MKISANNITISYSQSGDTAGTPVIFLHGFPFSRKMWDAQLALFKNLAGFQAIALDTRGHGKSSVDSGQYSIEIFGEDLFALKDKLHFKKVILTWLSRGGTSQLLFDRSAGDLSRLKSNFSLPIRIDPKRFQ